MMNIEQLQQAYNSPGKINIYEAYPGFIFIDIINAHCQATLSLYGGQLLRFKHKDYDELLYLSEHAVYEKGKSIRGGVPVCWPAFGASNPDIPFHGFVRNHDWQLDTIEQLDKGDSRVAISIASNDATKQIWPYEFELRLVLTLGSELKMELSTQNTGSVSFEITQALHSYFSVDAIEEAVVSGLDGLAYLDTTIEDKSMQRKTQSGDVVFESEVDNVYMGVTSDLCVKTGAGKGFVVHAEGSETTVVWNPGPEISAAKGDMADDDYRYFCCVETANALEDKKRVNPGESITMTAVYRLSGCE